LERIFASVRKEENVSFFAFKITYFYAFVEIFL